MRVGSLLESNTHEMCKPSSQGCNMDFELAPLDVKRLASLRRICLSVFPVPFQQDHYKSALREAEAGPLSKLNKLAFCRRTGRLAGAVCCRAVREGNDRGQNAAQAHTIYVMCLGVLTIFRERGVGTVLLQHVLDSCRDIGVKRVEAHTQCSNDAALALYGKLGFARAQKLPRLYPRLADSSAFLLRAQLESDGGVDGRACDSSSNQSSAMSSAAQVVEAVPGCAAHASSPKRQREAGSDSSAHALANPPEPAAKRQRQSQSQS